MFLFVFRHCCSLLNLQQCSLKLLNLFSHCSHVLWQYFVWWRSVCSALIEALLLFRRASVTPPSPPLPPIFYSQCFTFTYALWVTVNIVSLVVTPPNQTWLLKLLTSDALIPPTLTSHVICIYTLTTNLHFIHLYLAIIVLKFWKSDQEN